MLRWWSGWAANQEPCSENMQIVRHLDERIWRALVESHPRGNIFHTPIVFQVFARAKGYTPAYNK